MVEWRIEQLDRSHDRAEFSSGKAPLDHFIRSLVSQYDRRNLGRTYVAVQAGERQVLGYYTLSSGSVSFQNLPATSAKKLPKHPVPVVLLARLAVDESVQGQGLGAALLTDALARSIDFAKRLGIHAVEVDAIDDTAKAFYEKYGFVPLLDNPLHLYLPISTIRQAFESAERAAADSMSESLGVFSPNRLTGPGLRGTSGVRSRTRSGSRR